ncbi:MAG: hypothetical protein IT196_13630 [Acidimicrobiales bacterium]|nr:hypothetical protein [Acidimicrobiales bacterium]
MPWCDPCERFFNPNTLNRDGTCPSCGKQLAEPQQQGWRSVPWHFWLLLGALVLYLGWRLIQGVAWATGLF